MSTCIIIKSMLESLHELILADTDKEVVIEYINMVQLECKNCEQNIQCLFEQLALYQRTKDVIDKALESTLEFQSLIDRIDIKYLLEKIHSLEDEVEMLKKEH